MQIKITGTGRYVPDHIETNTDFSKHIFLQENGTPFEVDNDVIIQKFKNITGIEERRYAKPHHTASDLAFFAAEKAIDSSGIDPETLDYIIIAHNFGDVKPETHQTDALPTLATRVKHHLGIKSADCVCYDLIFGCPGWVEGVIQAQAYIKAGMARKCLVIGAETLSRVIDENDRDSMIYADGAGAAVIELTNEKGGILAHKTATFTNEEAFYLYYGKSFNPQVDQRKRYIKMYGRKVYEFALSHVPQALKTCLEKSGKTIEEVKKVFLHQANEKMDEAIIKRFYRLHKHPMPKDALPMSISKLGNSSVATIPTLLDLVSKNELEGHHLSKGDVILFGSVGAGMNINAIAYQV